MNVGPANTIRPVNSTVEVRQQGERNASSFEQDELPAKGGGSSESDGPAENKIDARETLRLLSEGRIIGIEGARFRLHFREAAGSSSAAGVRADAERLTETTLAPLRELLNVGLFDEETRALLEEAFAQLKTDVDALQPEEDKKAFDAEQLYLDLQEAFEQYHEMLKRIFRLIEAATEEKGEGEAAEAVDGEPGAPSERIEAEAVRNADPAGEAEQTVAEKEEELVHRVLEAVEQSLEDIEENAENAEALAPPGGPGSEDESVYAKFVTAYERLSEAPAGVEAFSTEG